jgi:hypothetical protein
MPMDAATYQKKWRAPVRREEESCARQSRRGVLGGRDGLERWGKPNREGKFHARDTHFIAMH